MGQPEPNRKQNRKFVPRGHLPVCFRSQVQVEGFLPANENFLKPEPEPEPYRKHRSFRRKPNRNQNRKFVCRSNTACLGCMRVLAHHLASTPAATHERRGKRRLDHEAAREVANGAFNETRSNTHSPGTARDACKLEVHDMQRFYASVHTFYAWREGSGSTDPPKPRHVHVSGVSQAEKPPDPLYPCGI